MLLKRYLLAAFTVVCLGVNLFAQDNSLVQENWHQFRGPVGNGVSDSAKPPIEWNAEKNIAWKTEIPGSGSGSPIVWGDRVFVVTAVPVETGEETKPSERLSRDQIREKFDEDQDGQLSGSERSAAIEFMQEQRRRSIKPQQFVVYCFDRKDGARLWKQIAVEQKPFDSHHDDHGYASASPVTDGEHLFVSFGSYGIYCYDMDGQLIWKRTDLGEMKTRAGFGEGSSLALYGDKLILPWDHEGQSRIEVIDKANGKTVWKKARDEPSNWLTPRVVVVNSRPMVIHGGENFTRGYDLETGDEIWKAAGLTSRPVASSVVKGQIAVFASARRGPAMAAFHLDRTGEVSEKAWMINRQTPDCPSLALSENRLYFLSGNQALISCANFDSGELFFGPNRLSGLSGIYSSPVVADGKVFVTGRNGKTVVLQDGSDFKVLQSNDIGEPVDATLALAGDQIFIRGNKHLFCVQE